MALSEKGVVDTHCHLWRLKVSSSLSPELGRLFRTFDSNDLAEASRSSGVTSCVVVEAGDTVEENRELERMAASSALISAIIPFVDLERPDLAKELDYWQQNPNFRGVRMRFEGHPDDDIVSRPAVAQGLGEVEQRGLVFDFLARAVHLENIVKLYERLPELRGVLEHMAKPDVVEMTDRAVWLEGMKQLARNTNVKCKLSLSPRKERMDDLIARPGQGWSVESIGPFVQFLLEEFGPDRCMWGSDWPVALLTSDYAGTYQAMRDAIGPLSTGDELRIFRTNAVEFYRLDPG